MKANVVIVNDRADIQLFIGFSTEAKPTTEMQIGRIQLFIFIPCVILRNTKCTYLQKQLNIKFICTFNRILAANLGRQICHIILFKLRSSYVYNENIA
jgi:hypothetical protein